MAVHISNLQLSEAVFQHVDSNTYPEDEQVISSDLPTSALRELSELVEKARNEVKTSIRELSKLTAPGVGDWILEAKQLQRNIAESGTQAEQIRQISDGGDRLRAEEEDAQAKTELLRAEVAFNDNLFQTLELINLLRGTIDQAHDAILEGRFQGAVQLFQKGEGRLRDLHVCQKTRIADLARARLADLHHVLEESLTTLWKEMICITENGVTVTVAKGPFSTKLEMVVEALDQLDLLPSKILLLRKAFDQAMAPRFQAKPKGISVTGNTILTSEPLFDPSSSRLFADIGMIIQFISKHLPASISKPLIQSLVPTLISRVIHGPLTASVPIDVGGISQFQETLAQTLAFATSLHEQGINGYAELGRWASIGPNVWLKRRSEVALHSVRQLLLHGLGTARTVERVEKQMVTRQDDVFASQDKNGDWDAGWSDGEPVQHAGSAKQTHDVNADDEGEDAWGLIENALEASTELAGAAEPDEAEAWGWGDEDKPESPQALRPAKHIEQQTGNRNAHLVAKASTEREVTLRETYTITALPEGILEVIISVVEDADRLAEAESSSFPMAPASAGLYSLPSVILTLFRASAPNVYTSHPSGHMYLYNDNLYLAEQLRSFAAHRSRHSTSPPDLESDASALELRGRRAYSQEMETQRTILRDLIDGAQGFVRCVEPAFAQQCELAIASSIDRIRAMQSQWEGVLSRSALFQALGSLLSTLASRILLDVADLGDISEAESQSLTHWCTQVEALEDLFLPEASPTTAESTDSPVPLTAVYTPGWLKFRYLTNVLESSLADIKYLWTEGELAMEFAPDEVVDFIEALFADSEHRRKAVAEIRRASRMR